MNLLITKLNMKLNEFYNKIKKINLIKKKQENKTKNDLFIEFNELHNDFIIVQQYINEINESYINHKLDCEKIPTQLESMLIQINTINEKLADVPNLDDYNLKEIATQTDSLILSTNSLLEEIENTQNGSDKSLAKIQRELDQLNIDMDSCETSTSSLSAEISTTNENVASTQTQIDNINTTQTTQSQKQNTLTNKTSTINSRLTTAEKNISALTGGVDVSKFDSKIKDLEEIITAELPSVVCYNNYPMFLKLTSSAELGSLHYYYKINSLDPVKQKFNINYTSSGDGTLTIKLMQNSTEVSEFLVELSRHPSSFDINYTHFPNETYQSFEFKFSTTSTDAVHFDSIEVSMIGKGIQLFEHDKDLKISCFDNNVYVLRYYNHELKTGKFTMDNISLEPSSLTEPFYNNALDCGRNYVYGPYLSTTNSIISTTSEAQVVEDAIESRLQITIHNLQLHTMTLSQAGLLSRSGILHTDTHPPGASVSIKNLVPCISAVNSNSVGPISFQNIETYKPGKWYFANIVKENNYINNQSTIRPREQAMVVAYNEDGNMYLINEINVKGVSLIGKGGKFATAYYQIDGTISVYINRQTKTYKYTLTPNPNNQYTYNSVLVDTYDDCDCVYEIYNGKYVKHTSSGWVIV